VRVVVDYVETCRIDVYVPIVGGITTIIDYVTQCLTTESVRLIDLNTGTYADVSYRSVNSYFATRNGWVFDVKGAIL
jgi:putative flippase GtrA